MDKLVEIFCDVDDFCLVFMPTWQKQCLSDGRQKRLRSGKMTMSEIMTILIFFHMSYHRNFKSFYTGYLCRFFKNEFPHLLSYTRFLEMIPRALIPLSSYFATIKGKATGIEFVDSTSLKVCHNLRIPRHRTFKGIAMRGKGTMGWFYGFKLHLIVSYKGEIIAAKITPANVHDTKPVTEMSSTSMEKLYGDRGYISKALGAELFDKGITLITHLRKNMKAVALSLWDRAMLAKRFIIETINDQLKNISQIEHSRHRSVHGFMSNVLGALVAYSLKENKPHLNLCENEINIMTCA